jgi:membrane protease YdiL (CAAX protease family)
MNQFVSKHRLVFFYLFAFLISWTFWFLMSQVYTGGQPGMLTYLFSSVGGLGPLLSLLLLQKLTDQQISVKGILSQIKIRQIKNPWAFLAIFALPVITLLGNLGYYALGQESQLRVIKPGPDELGFFVVLVMAIQFTAGLVTSPLFEEPGWRGFALSPLQRRYGKVLGSLVVGLLWWVWHQPMNLTFGLQPSIYSALSMVTISFTIDSLFNLSGQNLFTAMLAHQSYGTVFTFLYEGEQNWLILGLKIIFVAAIRVIEHLQDKKI